MARTDPQVNLRMPADLKDRLDAAAAENKRSLTAEIVAALEEKYPAPLAMDYEAFLDKWIQPILEADSNQIDRLVREADAAVKKLDPGLSVWPIWRNRRMTIHVGIKPGVRLPEPRNIAISKFLTQKKTND